MNMHEIVGTHDILMITLDTLRYDAAVDALQRGLTPTLADYLADGQWQERHSPASFTFAAHQAFFAGFLPTPIMPGKHPRLFAARFAGSETTTETTFVFDTPDIISGFSAIGYHTICIGGVGFFNKQTPLACVLPDLFSESHWTPQFSVTDPDSTHHQVQQACASLTATDERVFMFINIAALHQPNYFYVDNATTDTYETHIAALAYVDSQLLPLFDAFRKRAPTFVILCADHGTTYGEDGYTGHRIGHPLVWTVPYAEFIL